jgi:hypothetical protein
MSRSWWCLCAFLIACGGGSAGSAPAESPADVDGAERADRADSPPVDSSAATSDAAGAEAAPKSDGPAATGEATKEDVQTVLQLVIDDEELNPFLHLDRPDRFPLKVAGSFPPGIALVKATKPVEIVDAAEAKGDKPKPVLVFTEIEVQPARATVRYRYDIEGVKGACTLEKREGRWVLAKSRITER